MTTLADLLKEDVEAVQAELVKPDVGPPKPRAKRNEVVHAELAAIEDELQLKSAALIDAALDFGDIPEDQLQDPERMNEVPPAWVERYGSKEAAWRFRAAKYALMPKKDAPGGLDIAMKMYTSIAKAKSNKKIEIGVLNVAAVQMSAPMPKFEEIDEQKDEESD
jgi:hypothetical protein